MIIFDLPDLWLPRPRAIIRHAAATVGLALMPYTGLDPAESFNAVYGPTYMRFTSTLTTHALALWGGIRFQSDDVITLPLVIHELGHLFGVRARNKPTKQLWLDRNKLDTRAGSLYPGYHPPSLPKYNIVEQFCNAWEARVIELYAHDARGITPAGAALRAWFDEYLPAWVAVAMERKP